MRELLDELIAEHERAAATVALSYAEDADLDGLVLGGELHPFQRAGVRYALERRRTFIADEQGLGKTVQALATLEADDAFPAVVICPASMKLDLGAREPATGCPSGAWRCSTGAPRPPGRREAESAEIVVLNYDILEAHAERLAQRAPRALVLDESHYVKNPQRPAHEGGARARGPASRRARCGSRSPARRSSTGPRSWSPSCACWAASRSSAAARA